MTQVLLQVNFDLDPSRNEEIDKTLERARRFEHTPGLLWKVWLRDNERRRGGGIYLFADRASAEAWGKGRFETMAERMPWSSNIRHEYFEVEETLTAITGPQRELGR